MKRLGVFAISLWGLCSACQTDAGEGDAGVACDPFASSSEPIELSTVVGAGRDAEGTIYVVDRSGYDLRAFISVRGVLTRERVSGFGEEHELERDLVSVVLSERIPVMHVAVETKTDGSRRMGVLEGPLATKTFVIGEEGEELALLEESDVSSMPIENYAAEVEVEYAAQLADERLLVVVRPREPESYDDYRLFFGEPQQLSERSISSFQRQRDGGTTTIAFEVDGAAVRAFFPVLPLDDMLGFMPGPPELTVGGEDVALSLLPKVSPAGAAYFCRE